MLEVNRLQEAELLGENLGLVTGVFLLDEQRTRLYVRPENENLLNIIVPVSVAPVEYRLEIEWKSRVPFAITNKLTPTNLTINVGLVEPLEAAAKRK